MFFSEKKNLSFEHFFCTSPILEVLMFPLELPQDSSAHLHSLFTLVDSISIYLCTYLLPQKDSE